LSNIRARTHCRNSSTLRELLRELQYLHAGTLFARPRPPYFRGCRWSAVKMNSFLTSVSASAREYSCAPQYQHRPPLFAQTYCRLIRLTDKGTRTASSCSFISASAGHWPTASSPPPNSTQSRPPMSKIEAAYRKSRPLPRPNHPTLSCLNTAESQREKSSEALRKNLKYSFKVAVTAPQPMREPPVLPNRRGHAAGRTHLRGA
jgi:hypothetical protein